MVGDFTFTAGQVLTIVVGQKGGNEAGDNNRSGGGGGGSFVYTASTLHIAAGGGAGKCGYSGGTYNYTTANAVTVTAGNAGSGWTIGTGGAGGTNGTGGAVGGTWGAGGAGWLADGADAPSYAGNQQGISMVGGWLGGSPTAGGGFGGFGGAGAGGIAYGGGGGGGGYSGGGGGTDPGSGGGAGSFNAGINQTNTPAINTGDGLVILTLLCNPATVPTNTTLAANQSICANNTTTLTVNGTPTLSWYATNVSTVVLGTGSVFVTPTLAVGVYTYYAASTNTCAEGPRAPITVTVNASPSVAVAGPTAAVCPGSSVNLTASGAATYSWNNGAVTSTIAPTPTANASYTVVGTSSVGCSANAVVAVTVNAAPSVSIAGAGTICAGNATVLTASGADTYSWNTGATTASIAASPTANTTYTAMGTNSLTGCSNTISASIVVSPCTGISTVSSIIEGLSIYPNPSSGAFTIELNGGVIQTIEVRDVTGKIVLAIASAKEKENINISHLSNGIYFLKVQGNNIFEVVKIVKQ